MITTIRRLITLILLITAPLWISSLLWQIKPTLPLKLSLVDYTVPYDNYAEHNASVWAFNHLKLKPPHLKKTKNVLDPSTTRQDKVWHNQTAYVGPEPFKPYIQKRLSQTYPLHSIQQSKTTPFDLVYVADTYGVYREDFVTKIEQDGQMVEISSSTDPKLLKTLFDQGKIDAHMDFSRLIFGGLSTEDIEVLELHTDKGGDVFFEFNAFCDPTSTAVRQRAEEIVGVHWTGWSGRFLPDPHDLNDSPHWLKRLYQKQFPNKELPKGPSLLLVHRDGRIFLVESDEDVSSILPTLHVREKYRERLPMANTPYYYFWFAIMTPDKALNTQVLAEIHLHAPKGQKNIYELLNLPTRIPLLTERVVGQSHRYHFAIDGSDIRENLGSYPYAGLAFLNSLSPRTRGESVSQRQVFWQFYLPMLKTILWERSQDRYPNFPPPLGSHLIDFISHSFSK